MTIKSAVFGLGVFAAMLAGTAHAETRVAFGRVKGRGAAAVRRAALHTLQQGGATVLSEREIVKAAKRLRVGSSTASGRRQLSKSLGIGTWIEGSVERKKRGAMVAELRVIEASSQKTLASLTYDGLDQKALLRVVQDEFWNDASKLVQGTAVPDARSNPPLAAAVGKQAGHAAAAADIEAADPAAASAAATPKLRPEAQVGATPQDEQEDAVSENPARAEPSAANEHGEELADLASTAAASPLDIGIGLAGFNRDFHYRDNLSALRQYGLGLGPTLALNIHWYPAAHFAQGFARNIGLDLRGQLAFGIDSQLEKNVSFPTSSGGFGVGVRARVPIEQHQLAAVVGYDRKTFAIGQPTPGANGEVKHPFIPGAAYSYLRVGVELRFAIGDRLSLAQSVAYLHTFSTGMDSWFPRATAGGVEGDLKLGYAIAKNFEANAALGVQRFALAFNPTLQDAAQGRPIAGGAIDQYVSVALGMLWRMGS